MMRRNAGHYVKRWAAALIRGAATNAEFTVFDFRTNFCLLNIQLEKLHENGLPFP